jgi:hypothetical protein
MFTKRGANHMPDSADELGGVALFGNNYGHPRENSGLYEFGTENWLQCVSRCIEQCMSR